MRGILLVGVCGWLFVAGLPECCSQSNNPRFSFLFSEVEISGRIATTYGPESSTEYGWASDGASIRHLVPWDPECDTSLHRTCYWHFSAPILTIDHQYSFGCEPSGIVLHSSVGRQTMSARGNYFYIECLIMRSLTNFFESQRDCALPSRNGSRVSSSADITVSFSTPTRVSVAIVAGTTCAGAFFPEGFIDIRQIFEVSIGTDFRFYLEHESVSVFRRIYVVDLNGSSQILRVRASGSERSLGEIPPNSSDADRVLASIAGGLILFVKVLPYTTLPDVPEGVHVVDAIYADINSDGTVDDADLLSVLFDFGRNSLEQGAPLRTDINFDGTVDDADLIRMIMLIGYTYIQ